MKRLVAATLAGLLLSTASLTHAASLRAKDSDGLNLRAGPGTTHRIVGGMAAVESATVIGEQDGWFRVRTSYGLEGWASGEFSRVMYYNEVAIAYVNTDVLNVRAEPNTTSEIRTQIKQDQQVQLLEQVTDWWRIRLADGVEGWVSGQYMRRQAAATPPPPTTPTTPPAPPTTPPAPPTKPPTTPAPAIPETAPPAPASAVPVLAPTPPAQPIPVGAKVGQALISGSLYLGRNSQAFRVTGTVSAGEKLTFLDSAEGWWKVQTLRGEKGWIPGSSVLITEGNVRYSITEGRWTIGYTGPSASVPTAPVYTVKLSFALMVQENGGIALLYKGDTLELLESKGAFLRVKTAQGQIGLVDGAAVAVTSPAQAPDVTDALVATLQAAEQGTVRLAVEAKGKPLGQITTQGNTLTIPMATGQKETRALPVGAAGVQSMAITPTGLQITFSRLPGYQVTQTEPGKLSVTFRPALKAIESRTLPDRTAIALKVDGLVTPVISASGSSITVDLPGVIAVQPLTVPAGAKLEATATGSRLVFTSRRAYALKRTETGLELNLYAPGLKDKVILLDPGHGGFDPGAGNSALGITEQAVNLQIALRLRALLEAKGAKVYMTRIANTSAAPAAVLSGLSSGEEKTQVDLGYRTRMGSELKTDLFLSIHHNAGDKFVGGTEIYYTSGTLNGGRSTELARTLQSSLVSTLQRKDRGIHNDLMYVTRNTDAPAVLVEVAFLDHEWEARLSRSADFQHKAAEALVKGLEAFYAERP